MNKWFGYFGVLGAFLVIQSSDGAAPPTILFPGGNWEALYSWREAVCTKTPDGIEVSLVNKQLGHGKLHFRVIENETGTPSGVDGLVFTDRGGLEWSLGAQSRCTPTFSKVVANTSFDLELTCKGLTTPSEEGFSRSLEIKNSNPIHCSGLNPAS